MNTAYEGIAAATIGCHLDVNNEHCTGTTFYSPHLGNLLAELCSYERQILPVNHTIAIVPMVTIPN